MGTVIPFPAMTKGTGIVKIETQVLALLATHDMRDQIPVPIVDLCHAEGIKVLESGFTDPEISGLIFGVEGRYTIYINQDDPSTRKRFTIAHELGHYLLHLRDQESDKGFRDLRQPIQTALRNPDNISPYEREANLFAAAILMPEPQVLEYEPVADVVSLAQIFSVSAQAMRIRLQDVVAYVRS